MLSAKQLKYLRILLAVMSFILIGLLSDATRTIFRPLVSPNNYWSWFMFIMFYELWMLTSNIHIMKTDNQSNWKRTEKPKFRIVLNISSIAFTIYAIVKADFFLYLIALIVQTIISLFVAVTDLKAMGGRSE